MTKAGLVELIDNEIVRHKRIIDVLAAIVAVTSLFAIAVGLAGLPKQGMRGILPF